MVKAEMIKEISRKTGIEKTVIETTIEAFTNVVKEKVSDNKPVTLRGFGNFTTKKRAAKVARNIAKNTPMPIAAHYIPVFIPAKKFKDRVKKSIQ
ncbi:MAG TPA: HU family DNA-binding protein [Bacteroidia bacterium]|jgi:DNA-binding protein HU-beta|nr:HU family DNA-binding protein [Bacteroidia bacterium]